jgi:hypothetical protein
VKAQEDDPMSILLPRLLAMSIFKFNYRLLLSSAYRRLLYNAKAIDITVYHEQKGRYF